MGKFPHSFTKGEQIKGGSASTERKRLACKMNPLKRGKYAQGNELKRCDSCEFAGVCNFFEKGAACKPQVSTVQALLKMHASSNPNELFAEVNHALQELRILIAAKPKGKENSLFRYADLLLKFGRHRFGAKIELSGEQEISLPVLQVQQIFQKMQEVKAEEKAKAKAVSN